MRAEGSHRVVLNSPIQKTLLYGNPKGEKPGSSEHFQFIGVWEGKMTTLLVKVCITFSSVLAIISLSTTADQIDR